MLMSFDAPRQLCSCYVFMFVVDCEQSLFFPDISESNASPVSRNQSRAWLFACLALQKRETARSLEWARKY